MSEVIVAQEQLELVNIVQIVQTKLSKNFTLLLKRLNHHDALLTKHETQSAQSQLQTFACFKKIEENMELQNQKMNQHISELLTKMQLMEDCQKELMHEAGERRAGLKRLSDELFTTQLQFEEKQKQKQLEFDEATKTIDTLLTDQSRLSQQINNKESKVESEKIAKQIETLKDKNIYLENELKLANHKIQKMEILNQKAERIQVKKEVEIIKQIEEKIRKEIKTNGSTAEGFINGSDTRNSSFISNVNGEEVLSNEGRLSLNQDRLIGFNAQGKENTEPFESSGYRRINSLMIDNSNLGIDPTRNSMDGLLQKWGDKIRYLQAKLKDVIQNLKVLNKNQNSMKGGEVKDNSSEGIKDKINEIKPEIVKLWAKLDTVQDRLSFNQRKLEEKTKCINELATMIKDNNISRLQQKLKNLQTQNFASLKEVRAKLQTKVNQTEYDKYCRNIDDRIAQINEMIYLKSDKLQVKKALLFLESKIKEIILVISEDEENEKDALLTKKQLKCISCDKELDKFSGVVSASKGNWDGLPFKDHPPQILGRFGMTNFGSLSKKIKKLQGKDLPVLTKRSSFNQSLQSSPTPCKQ